MTRWNSKPPLPSEGPKVKYIRIEMTADVEDDEQGIDALAAVKDHVNAASSKLKELGLAPKVSRRSSCARSISIWRAAL